ncbi:MAG: rod-binding protein [Planctomycetes bacterium]|nr:rod-binding protein [Planctomycetota bacterium]
MTALQSTPRLQGLQAARTGRTLPAGQVTAKSPERVQAEQTAEQFEAILVRQLVGSMRQTSSIGESGGLFGGGLGADTYADWFDQNMAEHIGSTRQLGIKQSILDGIERAGQLAADDAETSTTEKMRAAARAADHARLLAMATRQGGIDVTR